MADNFGGWEPEWSTQGNYSPDAAWDGGWEAPASSWDETPTWESTPSWAQEPVDPRPFQQEAAAQFPEATVGAQVARMGLPPGDVGGRNAEHEAFLRDLIQKFGLGGAIAGPPLAAGYNVAKAALPGFMLPGFNPARTTPSAWDLAYWRSIMRPSWEYFTRQR